MATKQLISSLVFIFSFSIVKSSASEGFSHLSDEFLKSEIENLDLCIDVRYVDEVRDYFETYLNTKQDWTQLLFERSELYFPIFETLLKAHQLPDELKFLPIIESGLSTTAKSRAGAMGLWQFMPGTAKMMGLKVNSAIDQRLDPWSSTEAALEYLSMLHKDYQDWTLALAAYNCGPGNVNKAIRRAGSKDFWSIRKYLPLETRRYVPKFIAAAYFMQNHQRYNINPPKVVSYPEGLSVVQVFHSTNFKDIADITGIDVSELQYLNPAYKRKYLPGGLSGYNITFPSYMADRYIQNFNEDSEHSILPSERKIFGISKKNTRSFFDKYRVVIVNEEITRNHRVVRGDNLYTLARNYGISLSRLKAQNSLKSDLIKPGQGLKIRKIEKVRKYIPIVAIPENLTSNSLELFEINPANSLSKYITAHREVYHKELLKQSIPSAKDYEIRKKAFLEQCRKNP